MKEILKSELPYAITTDVSELVTVRVTPEDYSSLWRKDENQITLRQLLKEKLNFTA